MSLSCIIAFNSCSEDLFDEKYADPSKTSDVGLDKLMTGTLLKSKDWVMSTYGRFFGWEIQNLCKQANTIGFTPDNGTYYNIEGYTDGLPPYGNLAQLIAEYKLMRSIYNLLPEADKKENEVCLLAVETIMYGMAAYIMSGFGDIPFDEVGKVTETGSVADAHPHYQDDKELFKKILDRLGELNIAFKDAQKSASFGVQDFICNGDLSAWRRLANSLRLRAALLVSTNGPLTSEGQKVIKEILEGDRNTYPLIETNEDQVCYKQVKISGSELDINGGSGFDWVNLKTASTEIINRMQKAGDGGVWNPDIDDPRLPIFFCLATKNGEFPVNNTSEEVDSTATGHPEKGKAMPTVFRGASANMSYSTFWKYFTPSDNRAYFSRIREYGFFRNNRNWDNPVVTAAEIQFIKAEAYKKGWASGDAKQAFKEGIKQSIKFYMNYHKERSHTEAEITGNDRASNHARAVIDPNLDRYTDAWIDAFAEARWTKRVDESSYAGGELEAILEQKWLSFGYEYAGEQWNDLRRTGYPRMYYQRDNDPAAEIPYPRNRHKYPGSDRDYNMNFTQVVGNDNYSGILFWAIPDGNWHDGPKWDNPQKQD
jgi:hypothetical protein